MITRTIVVFLGYLCVAGFVANGQQSCNSTNTCSNNQKCVTASYGSMQCNWGACACPSGMRMNTSTCVTPTVNVGGGCAFTSDCKGSYTYCNSTWQCACLSNAYMVNSDSSDCTPAPKTPLNSNCTATNPTCGAAAWCNSGTCQCLATYTPIGGNNNVDCRPMVPNDPCSNVTDCGVNSPLAACKNANCSTGTYQCNPGYWWVTSNTPPFAAACVPTSVSANVNSGQACADGTNNGNYKLCAAGLTCVACPESISSGTYTCQTVASTTTTTVSPGGGSGGASNVRLDIMALVAALALFRFAA